MPFKTPKFWYRTNTMSAFVKGALQPIASLYQIGHRINSKNQKSQKVKIPVICIGNITAGGSGKTPTTIAINKVITENKLFNNPCFLTRGYGAKNQFTRFISVHEPIDETGDEPKILLNNSKTIISKNRYEGAKLAQKSGHDIVIMDDGFQNNTVYKDISLLVVDGNTGFGNECTLPAGPLREPIRDGINKANAIILIGDDINGCLKNIPPEKPIFKATIKAKLDEIDLSKEYLAFCGLAHPSKFFGTLNTSNINVIEHKEFADHHPYTQNELNQLIERANKIGAKLITTEKDFVKIPLKFHDKIRTLPIELIFGDEKQLTEFLKSSLSGYIENT